jgi:hypothetical protein
MIYNTNMTASVPVYMEVLDFLACGTTSRSLAEFRPSPSVETRVADLIARQKGDGLSSEEALELADYIQLEHIMIMAKARARQKMLVG